jgi:predicted ester cyclase
MPSLSDRHILARGGNSALGLATAASFSDRVLAVMLLGILALMLSGTFASTLAAATELLQPHSLIIDGSLPTAQVDAQTLAARRYATFWSTGDEALARAALAHDFTDRTLPAGRPQGLAGPLASSKLMRAAIPDIRCEIEQMIVAGDRVVVHLHFRGHFTGRFTQTQGQGQAVDFAATDIYRIANGRIADNWHIEDNLTLMQQLDLVAKRGDPQ